MSEMTSNARCEGKTTSVDGGEFSHRRAVADRQLELINVTFRDATAYRFTAI